MTVVRQESRPPPSAMVLDRCGVCGELISDEMIQYRDRGRRYCDRCDGNKLPKPWSDDVYYDEDDEAAEPPPECSCGCMEFITTFTRPNGETVEFTVDDGMWCEDHAVYHLRFDLVVPGAVDDEDDPIYQRARCASCDRVAYVGYDWEA